MSNETRAALIGLLGPAISASGLVWVVLKPVISGAPEMTFRYLIFDPGHLLIAAGILVTAICLPVALQVVTAGPEEVTLPDFEAGLEEPEAEQARQPDTAQPHAGTID